MFLCRNNIRVASPSHLTSRKNFRKYTDILLVTAVVVKGLSCLLLPTTYLLSILISGVPGGSIKSNCVDIPATAMT